LYGNAGERLAIDAGPRYDSLTELVDEIGDKVIIFCPLRGAQAWLFDKLTAQGYDVAMVHGDTTKNERNTIFSDFQNTERIRILLAHPKVAAHGLTLTRAKDIIWYAPIYSLEQYEQANARIRRLTTSGKTNVWHIYATKFEAELYRRLQQKKRVLGDFLKLVQGVNDEL
jgi:SNF2 family DNA or RNA helicase